MQRNLASWSFCGCANGLVTFLERARPALPQYKLSSIAFERSKDGVSFSHHFSPGFER